MRNATETETLLRSKVEGLYASMTTEQLEDLQRAFEMDKAEAPPDAQHTRDFADSRLAIIARELVKRGRGEGGAEG